LTGGANRMVTKKKTKKTDEIRVARVKRVEEFNIFDYNKALMMIFNKNVNLARSVPHVFDGLKVVERRVLYAMFFDHKGKKKKVAEIIGTVIGKYHPHGDSSPYGTLVGLGQHWNIFPLMIKPDGNYGSQYGDTAAAMRYIGAQMTEFTVDAYFFEWSKTVTDFNESYTGEYIEPEYLPSKYPMLFIKSIFGIGKGLMTGIPPYNLIELFDLTIKLIDNPDLKKVWLVPDMPNRCLIVDTDFKTMCETGEGKFRTRGELIVEDGDLIITSLPYGVSMDPLVAKIVELVNDKKFEGIADIYDESPRKERKKKGKGVASTEPAKFRTRIKLKKGFNPEKVKEALYRSTPLESTHVVRLEATFDYQNYRYSLKSGLLDWIELRRETKRRIYANQYSTISRRIHILETLISILSSKGGDAKLSKLAKASRNRGQMVEKLIKDFKLTDIQAEAIADMKMYQLSIDNMESFKTEKKDLEAKLKEVYDKMSDDSIVDEEIKAELREGKKKYGRKRLCDVVSISSEPHVPDTNHTIVITKKGLIKKLPNNVDGVGFIEPKDKATQIMKLNNKESLLVFDETGKVYSIAVNDIPESALDEAGVLLNRLIGIGSHRIVSILKKYDDCDKKDDKGPFYVFATANGMIKRSHCGNYSKVTKGGLVGIVLKSTDRLVSVIEVKGNKDIVLYTRSGHGIRYNTKEIPATLRMSSGVIGSRLTEEQMHVTGGVKGMTQIMRGDKYLFMLTNKGNGKKSPLVNFTDMKRGDENVQLSDLREDEIIVGIKPVKEDAIIDVFTSEKTVEINITDVPELTRRAKMKKLMGVRKGENIIDIN